MWMLVGETSSIDSENAVRCGQSEQTKSPVGF